MPFKSLLILTLLSLSLSIKSLSELCWTCYTTEQDNTDKEILLMNNQFFNCQDSYRIYIAVNDFVEVNACDYADWLN